MPNSQPNNKKLIAAAVIERDGKVLIAQRAREGDPLFGKWEFPGGKVEAGETLHECLKRELFEELGIQVEVGDYFCASSFHHKDSLFDMCVFRVPSFKGEIRPTEHSAIAWVFPADLSNYAMPDPDLPIVKLLQARVAP